MRCAAAIRPGWTWWQRVLPLLALLAAAAALPRPALAQPDELPAEALLSSAELERLVGPIALYPDDLIAIVLPAATYPLQIVQAARLLEERERNPGLEPDESWDDSVVALLNYPEVIELLNDDLDWTWQLGEAVLAQHADVLDAIQDFRDRAYAAGNLRSDERQVVTRDDGAIAIRPADPEVIYVPYYEPARVIVRHVYPVVHYYPWAYPVYYYPYPVGYAFHRFRTGFFWGVTTAFSIGWHTHHVHVHHHHHHAHPYFGRSYYDPFYVRRGVNININVVNNVWRPRYGHGARPTYRTRVDGVRVTRSAEGRAPRPQSRSVEGRAYRAPAARSVERAGVRSADAGRARAQTAPRSTTAARSAGTSAYRPRETAPGAALRAPARDAPAQRTYRSGGTTPPRADASRATRPSTSTFRAAPQRSAPGAGTAPARPAPARSTAPRSATVGSAPARSAARMAPAQSAPARSSAPARYSAPARSSAPTRSSAPARSSASRSSAPARSATSRSAPTERAAPRASGGGGRAASGGGSYRGGAAGARSGGQRMR